MYRYITTGSVLNELEPLLNEDNITVKINNDNNPMEWACYCFECGLEPKDMLPYLEKAGFFTRIIPIQKDDLKKRIRGILITNMAHVGYLSETDQLIIKA